MKKKILALFLCCVIVLGLLPTTLAFADETELKVSADTVSLKKSEKKDLTADAGTLSGTYQWQIQTGAGVWVNILGANGKTLTLKYGLVASLLQNNTARIRCHMTTDAGKALDSNVVTVEIQPDAAVAKAPAKAPAMSPAIGTVVTQATPIGAPVIVPGDTTVPAAEQSVTDNAPDSAPVADAAPATDASLAADATPAVPQSDDSAQNEVTNTPPAPTPTTYSIIINYIFADGKQAAPSWTATVATGSTYTQDIQSPVVVGYKPDPATVHVNAPEKTTYIVTYKPTMVDFTVKHYQQNVDNDNYTLVDTVTEKGFTESQVGDKLAKSYDGFYSLLYETTTEIAADGSTEVEIRYDRYYYLMNFNLDGGYGVEPIYARYGAAINVDTPTRPGYTFVSWTPPIPSTMPDHNTSYTASWKIGESGFTVVFWYENANDDGYSVAGTYTPADVAPGTQKKSEDYKNQSFTGRDDKHFTYNVAKSETVTVKGDGSTVLNVYYTRNAYTLTFKGGQKTLTCTKTEHTHSKSCCKKGGTGITHWWHDKDCCKLGLSEHTHSDSCYKTSDLTITAKYQADIHNNFPIKDGNDTIWWNVPQGTETYGNSDEQRYLGSIDTMPGENITFTKKGAESGAKIYYYVETLNGEQGDTTYNRRTYKQYKVIDLEYSSRTNLTYAEEFHPITGFSQGDSNPKLPVGGEVQMKETNYLYYTRNSYNLKFYNYNAYVDGKGGSVQYEAPLSSYYFAPEYPANLEKNAYVFDGWYTTAGCYEGSKADLNTMTMPASDVILYAKWVPKTHTVKTWLTKVEMDERELSTGNWMAVPHGTAVTNPPADPIREPYKFVGWFYISDTGEEKAFDFSMPVNRDLNLYAKWSSNTLMTYTVKYELGNGTQIAPPTTGSALAGSTKTFNAKTGTELNEGYQSGYFPKVSSHSLTIDIDGGNEYTFIYVPRTKVNYTVRYLDKATGEPVVVNSVPTPDKKKETSNAVVTETFKQITGYAPDAYQKQLVLAAEGNEIIFWYVKDEAHAPVHIIHWTQNIAGEGYTEYQSSTNLNGVIETEYSETPLTIAGFTYNGTEGNASGKLTAAGLVLNLYYDRIEYPYEFRFLEQGTESPLADAVTGNARYQAQVTQTAKTIPGYTLVSAENQAINIAIEDPANVADKNVKTFYYTEQTVEIKYEVVGPTGCGTLDNYQESQLKVITGEVKGSMPTVADGFKFVGWYKDQDCTQLVDADWVADSKLTPDKTKNYGTDEATVMGYEAATYYAKFEYDVANLTIIKQGWKEIDEGQSFIFDVTGPNGYSKRVVIKGNGFVTIKGLKIGTYTVTEVTSWSWRYKPDGNGKEITLKPGEPNTVTFTNSREKIKWLGGDDYNQNKFGNSN